MIAEYSLSTDPNIVDLLQREHTEILAEIGVGYGKSGFRLSAIKAGSSQSRPNIINEIFELVDKLDVIVKLVWIPSHLWHPR